MNRRAEERMGKGRRTKFDHESNSASPAGSGREMEKR